MKIATKIRRWAENWHKRPFRHISNCLYWLRTHTYNRYHIIDISNKRNGYAWGWQDRCESLLFANMAILVDFVEKEQAFNSHVSWESAEEAGINENDCSASIYNAHAFAKKEMLEIYTWWKKERREERDAVDWMYDEAYKDDKIEFEPISNGYFKLKDQPETELQKQLKTWIYEYDNYLDKKDDEMMIRLINVRGYMWT